MFIVYVVRVKIIQKSISSCYVDYIIIILTLLLYDNNLTYRPTQDLTLPPIFFQL